MHQSLTNLVASLDTLAAAVLGATGDDRTLLEMLGWNFPALSRHEFAYMATNLANRAKVVTLEDIGTEIIARLDKLPAGITLFISSSLPHMFNGNATIVVPNYLALLENIEMVLQPLYGWEYFDNNKVLPLQLARRIRAIQATMDKTVPEIDLITNKIKLINEASEAAESLPTDLQSLQEAKIAVTNLSTEAAVMNSKMSDMLTDSIKKSNSITVKKLEADGLVDKCEEAYRITTTKGLAAAFEKRAYLLSVTMWVWVGVLILALAGGSYIGASRYESLIAKLNSNTSTGVMWLEFTLSILGLAAPIWLAWLATKQISQRFRLTEDYSFKASVAKAYEGYRKEAVRFDPSFESRLFSSALNRLDEAPLRLVENDTYGSPWHELITSSAFQKAIEKVPDLKATFSSIASKFDKSTEGISTKDTPEVVVNETK